MEVRASCVLMQGNKVFQTRDCSCKRVQHMRYAFRNEVPFHYWTESAQKDADTFQHVCFAHGKAEHFEHALRAQPCSKTSPMPFVKVARTKSNASRAQLDQT